MIRAQFRLTEDEYAAARKEAARLGISFAQLVRRALQVALRDDPSKPWMRYAGMVDSGDPESSLTIDEFAFGSDR
jgi:hypothetical protein